MGYASRPTDDIRDGPLKGVQKPVLTTKTHGNKLDFALFVTQLKLGVALDGLVYVSPQELATRLDPQKSAKDGTYLVAMYAKRSPETSGFLAGNAFDFHFMRQNPDGTWSQKWGLTSATNRDESGNIMTDPLSANMSGYEFIGFYSVPKNGLDVGDSPRRYNTDPNNAQYTPAQRRTMDAKPNSKF